MVVSAWIGVVDEDRLKRHDLTDGEWARLGPLLPGHPRQGHRWNDHRLVIDGMFFRARAGCPWRDLPERFGNWKTVYNRHRRWSGDGTWEKILDPLRAGCDAGHGQGVDGGGGCDGGPGASACGRGPAPAARRCGAGPAGAGAAERSGAHQGTDELQGPGDVRPVPGRADQQDSPAGRPGVPAAGPGHQRRAAARLPGLCPADGSAEDRAARPGPAPDPAGPGAGDKAYSSSAIRAHLRRRGIKATIPEPADQVRHRLRRGSSGGRPPAFDPTAYKERNTVERAFSQLRQHRAVATRYDKRDFVWRGTIDVASIRIWLRRPAHDLKDTP